MIAKGTTHDNGGRLGRYLVTGKEGEQAELWELRGFASEDIIDAFRSIHVIADATKAEQPFFHVQVRNPEGETLTPEQWQYAADRIERMLGLNDQPRAIAFHVEVETGERHMHVAWSRIDEETLTAKPLPFYKDRLKKVSRELEMHFGLTLVPNHRADDIKYAPTRGEDEQARRLGLDAHELRQSIRSCWERSDCGKSFEAALAEVGMVLATGERRDFLVIDQAGGMHALGKRLLDVSAAEVRKHLADLSRDQLPSVEQARDFLREHSINKDPSKPAPVWDRDADEVAWQKAVVDGAIQKPKPALAKSVEPEGRPEKKEDIAAEALPPNLGRTAGEIRLSRTLTYSPQGFANALEDRGLFLGRVAAADLETLAKLAQRRADEKLAGHERKLAYLADRVTEEIRLGNFRKADALRRQSVDLTEQYEAATPWMARTGGTENLTEAQKAAALQRYERWGLKNKHTFEDYVSYVQDHWTPQSRFKEGDLVVVDRRGDVFQLTPRNTGLDHQSLKQFLDRIDHAPLPTVTESWGVLKDLHQHNREEERRLTVHNQYETASQETMRSRDLPGHLKGPSAAIWTAYNRNQEPDAFASALLGRNIQLAVVTPEEAERSRREAAFAQELGNFAPTYRPGEIVAVTGKGLVYKLNERTTGAKPEAIEAYLSKLDRNSLLSLDETTKQAQWRTDETVKSRRASAAPMGFGMVAQQSWALNRLRDEEDRRRKEENTRSAPDDQRRATAKGEEEIDLARFRTDPDYRRTVEARAKEDIDEQRRKEREEFREITRDFGQR